MDTVWNAYVLTYNELPSNAFKLVNFSREHKQLQTLSYNDAKDLIEQRTAFSASEQRARGTSVHSRVIKPSTTATTITSSSNHNNNQSNNSPMKRRKSKTGKSFKWTLFKQNTGANVKAKSVRTAPSHHRKYDSADANILGYTQQQQQQETVQSPVDSVGDSDIAMEAEEQFSEHTQFNEPPQVPRNAGHKKRTRNRTRTRSSSNSQPWMNSNFGSNANANANLGMAKKQTQIRKATTPKPERSRDRGHSAFVTPIYDNDNDQTGGVDVELSLPSHIAPNKNSNRRSSAQTQQRRRNSSNVRGGTQTQSPPQAPQQQKPKQKSPHRSPRFSAKTGTGKMKKPRPAKNVPAAPVQVASPTPTMDAELERMPVRGRAATAMSTSASSKGKRTSRVFISSRGSNNQVAVAVASSSSSSSTPKVNSIKDVFRMNAQSRRASHAPQQPQQQQPQRSQKRKSVTSRSQPMSVGYGDRVLLSKNRQGVVVYMGAVHFAQGTWIGVELMNGAVGSHDGRVDGRRYFQTRPNCGLFVPSHKIQSILGGTRTRTPQARAQPSPISTQSGHGHGQHALHPPQYGRRVSSPLESDAFSPHPKLSLESNSADYRLAVASPISVSEVSSKKQSPNVHDDDEEEDDDDDQHSPRSRASFSTSSQPQLHRANRRHHKQRPHQKKKHHHQQQHSLQLPHDMSAFHPIQRASSVEPALDIIHDGADNDRTRKRTIKKTKSAQGLNQIDLQEFKHLLRSEIESEFQSQFDELKEMLLQKEAENENLKKRKKKKKKKRRKEKHDASGDELQTNADDGGGDDGDHKKNKNRKKSRKKEQKKLEKLKKMEKRRRSTSRDFGQRLKQSEDELMKTQESQGSKVADSDEDGQDEDDDTAPKRKYERAMHVKSDSAPSNHLAVRGNQNRDAALDVISSSDYSNLSEEYGKNSDINLTSNTSNSSELKDEDEEEEDEEVDVDQESNDPLNTTKKGGGKHGTGLTLVSNSSHGSFASGYGLSDFDDAEIRYVNQLNHGNQRRSKMGNWFTGKKT